MREAEVEDGSLGTVTPLDFGSKIHDPACDIGIYDRRSVDDIPRLRFLAVEKSQAPPRGAGAP
jgi:hypothetical protein